MCPLEGKIRMKRKSPTEDGRIIRVALCQRNFVVGDIDGNLDKVRASLARVRELGADLALFPELSVTGYPPEDLLLKPSFAETAEAAMREFAAEVQDIVAIVGFPELSDDLFNAAAVITGGQVAAIYRKRYLPNYGAIS